MSTELSLKEIKKEWHGTFKAYLQGFVACAMLTTISFSLVIFKILSGTVLLYTLLALAIVQAGVQVRWFLHVGQEPKPRWETMIFFFMVLVILIVAIGSLWIMHDLNDRTMSEMTKMMTHD